jgi:hypothetical protein
MLWITAWSLWQTGSGGGGGPGFTPVYYPPISWGYRRQWFLVNGPYTPFQFASLYNWVGKIWRSLPIPQSAR